MNIEQIQALKAAAECATPGEWCTDDYHGVIADSGLNSNFYIATCSGPEHRQNKRFIAAANPAAILSLLAERDADKELIADLEQKHCGGALMEREEHHVGVVNKLLERIAELEARTVTVKLPRDITHVTNKYFEEGRDAVLEAIESQLAAAGITLVVGE